MGQTRDYIIMCLCSASFLTFAVVNTIGLHKSYQAIDTIENDDDCDPELGWLRHTLAISAAVLANTFLIILFVFCVLLVEPTVHNIRHQYFRG